MPAFPLRDEKAVGDRKARYCYLPVTSSTAMEASGAPNRPPNRSKGITLSPAAWKQYEYASDGL